MAEATWREIVEGHRFAGFQSFLKDECFALGLQLTIDSDRGWIRETTRFEVTGDEEKIAKLKRIVYGAIDSHNERRNHPSNA